MKYALAFLALPLMALAGFFVWLAMTYTVMETSTGGEYMILRAANAAECQAGCDPFSARELAALFGRLMREQRPKPSL